MSRPLFLRTPPPLWRLMVGGGVTEKKNKRGDAGSPVSPHVKYSHATRLLLGFVCARQGPLMRRLYELFVWLQLVLSSGFAVASSVPVLGFQGSPLAIPFFSGRSKNGLLVKTGSCLLGPLPVLAIVALCPSVLVRTFSVKFAVITAWLLLFHLPGCLALCLSVHASVILPSLGPLWRLWPALVAFSRLWWEILPLRCFAVLRPLRYPYSVKAYPFLTAVFQFIVKECRMRGILHA